MRTGLLLLLFTLSACTTTPPVRQTPPNDPEFFAKSLNCGGIVIRSSRNVSNLALSTACGKIDRMLAHTPNIRTNLADRKAELHIIGQHEVTSDLPEWQFRKNKIYIDNLHHLANIDVRTRGMGGLVASCGEENILHLPHDRYGAGSDICTHEFAHTIMDYGMDPGARSIIAAQYRKSTGSGLWAHHYAAVNAREYFAELSTWYFGAHGEFADPGHNIPAPGQHGLRTYDPEGFALLDRIYQGQIQTARIDQIPAQRLDTCPASNFDKRPANLVIINDLDQTVHLNWIDIHKNARPYATISTDERIERPTHISHVWALSDADNHPLGCWRVTTPNATIELHR